MVDPQKIAFWQGTLAVVDTITVCRLFVTGTKKLSFTVLVRKQCRGISFKMKSEAYLELWRI